MVNHLPLDYSEAGKEIRERNRMEQGIPGSDEPEPATDSVDALSTQGTYAEAFKYLAVLKARGEISEKIVRIHQEIQAEDIENQMSDS